jgi:uncharacterized membrane protein YqiK
MKRKNAKPTAKQQLIYIGLLKAVKLVRQQISRQMEKIKSSRIIVIDNFNCCLSVYVDNYTVIVPTKCTSLLKAPYITICTFLSLYS